MSGIFSTDVAYETLRAISHDQWFDDARLGPQLAIDMGELANYTPLSSDQLIAMVDMLDIKTEKEDVRPIFSNLFGESTALDMLALHDFSNYEVLVSVAVGHMQELIEHSPTTTLNGQIMRPTIIETARTIGTTPHKLMMAMQFAAYAINSPGAMRLSREMWRKINEFIDVRLGQVSVTTMMAKMAKDMWYWIHVYAGFITRTMTTAELENAHNLSYLFVLFIMNGDVPFEFVATKYVQKRWLRRILKSVHKNEYDIGWIISVYREALCSKNFEEPIIASIEGAKCTGKEYIDKLVGNYTQRCFSFNSRRDQSFDRSLYSDICVEIEKRPTIEPSSDLVTDITMRYQELEDDYLPFTWKILRAAEIKAMLKEEEVELQQLKDKERTVKGKKSNKTLYIKDRAVKTGNKTERTKALKRFTKLKDSHTSFTKLREAFRKFRTIAQTASYEQEYDKGWVHTLTTITVFITSVVMKRDNNHNLIEGVQPFIDDVKIFIQHWSRSFRNHYNYKMSEVNSKNKDKRRKILLLDDDIMEDFTRVMELANVVSAFKVHMAGCEYRLRDVLAATLVNCFEDGTDISPIEPELLHYLFEGNANAYSNAMRAIRFEVEEGDKKYIIMREFLDERKEYASEAEMDVDIDKLKKLPVAIADFEKYVDMQFLNLPTNIREEYLVEEPQWAVLVEIPVRTSLLNLASVVKILTDLSPKLTNILTSFENEFECKIAVTGLEYEEDFILEVSDNDDTDDEPVQQMRQVPQEPDVFFDYQEPVHFGWHETADNELLALNTTKLAFKEKNERPRVGAKKMKSRQKLRLEASRAEKKRAIEQYNDFMADCLLARTIAYDTHQPGSKSIVSKYGAIMATKMRLESDTKGLFVEYLIKNGDINGATLTTAMWAGATDVFEENADKVIASEKAKYNITTSLQSMSDEMRLLLVVSSTNKEYRYEMVKQAIIASKLECKYTMNPIATSLAMKFFNSTDKKAMFKTMVQIMEKINDRDAILTLLKTKTSQIFHKECLKHATDADLIDTIFSFAPTIYLFLHCMGETVTMLPRVNPMLAKAIKYQATHAIIYKEEKVNGDVKSFLEVKDKQVECKATHGSVYKTMYEPIKLLLESINFDVELACQELMILQNLRIKKNSKLGSSIMGSMGRPLKSFEEANENIIVSDDILKILCTFLHDNMNEAVQVKACVKSMMTYYKTDTTHKARKWSLREGATIKHIQSISSMIIIDYENIMKRQQMTVDIMRMTCVSLIEEGFTVIMMGKNDNMPDLIPGVTVVVPNKGEHSRQSYDDLIMWDYCFQLGAWIMTNDTFKELDKTVHQCKNCKAYTARKEYCPECAGKDMTALYSRLKRLSLQSCSYIGDKLELNLKVDLGQAMTVINFRSKVVDDKARKEIRSTIASEFTFNAMPDVTGNTVVSISRSHGYTQSLYHKVVDIQRLISNLDDGIMELANDLSPIIEQTPDGLLPCMRNSIYPILFKNDLDVI